MKKLLLVLFLISCGSNVGREDGGVVDSLLAHQDTTQSETIEPFTPILPKPIESIKAHELICSPPGIYTFKTSVYFNTCSKDVVLETYWETTKDVPSYDCGIYWRDGWSTHKTNKTVILYCDYYTYCEPYGMKLDTKCTVYSLISLEEEVVCMFSYATPWTMPQGG